MGLFFSAFVVGLAVALVFGLVVESCIGILPGDSTALAPFGGADDPEIFNIGGYALGFKIDIEQGSADTEEHPVLINRIQVEVDILEGALIAQGGDAVDVLVGSIRHIQAKAAADALERDAVGADLVVILSLEAAQFDFNGFTDLQNNSPFSFVDFVSR